MAEGKIVDGGKVHLRPHGRMAGLARLYSKPGLKLNLARIVEDDAQIDGLAKVLTRGIDTITTTDGRLDTRELAAYLLRAMKGGEP
jgi:hypothetical protein